MKKLLTPIMALVLSLLGTAAQAQAVSGDAKAGESKNAMCIGCHGIAGYQASFPEIYKVPMISGQSAKYIVNALKAYQSGDRKHPSMRGISASLSDQDMADLAAYYSQHGTAQAAKLDTKPSKEPSAAVQALLTKGNCVSCHGANLSTPIDPSYPKLGGQHADFLFVALKSYKTENQSTWGRNNGVMAGTAKQFSNAELKELSKYLSSLQGELKTVPQSKFK
jgi:cytochrome c553